ncbi:putative succinate--CoA ligase [GDP-forming] subunit beta, mitochondrial [Wickerhamiella sorbophila]|uniref:Succinate--CoA ligase [ADP-forming] subunit beta, mitochondrial n=1 Tax=Wickerhamiella sorbophila TaxID=45607 RepID=A0A2T0FLH1_9ASCO|nr:putative succinate--CoA ligase [GDP-forming] subunit beta, mitochondrial [Wickerhamiella sorbophila]PRT55820.1 putative succinate--CoA ligase [GDP-forming] subunit beta, mitochondrial [Wickerhamiella sorbophila]
MMRAGLAKKITPSVRQIVPRRFLSLHEYRSAQLLSQYNIGVPSGKPAFSGKEARQVAQELDSEDLVVKAQALTGGRGKGHFESGLKGGVKMVTSPLEAEMYADAMVGHKIFTKQTGEAGKKVSAVYIVQREFARREAYFSILYDRHLQQPMIVASSQGGMDIEGVAKDTPDAIHTFAIDMDTGVTPEQAAEVATCFGYSAKAEEEAAQTVLNLWKLFDERDCTLVEINPLSELVDNRVMAMDAKLTFDDNAAFRQKEVFEWRDLTQEDPEEVEASKWDLNFIKLDGNIGCLVNGAGLAMATLDIIKLNGGNPANFLDCGGGATAESIEKAFQLILTEPGVTSIFVNIFGGIVRCDAIAAGLIATAQKMHLTVPIVARLQGTNYEEAQELINNSGLKIFSYSDLDAAASQVVKLSQVVQLARESKLNVSFELPL